MLKIRKVLLCVDVLILWYYVGLFVKGFFLKKKKKELRLYEAFMRLGIRSNSSKYINF